MSWLHFSLRPVKLSTFKWSTDSFNCFYCGDETSWKKNPEEANNLQRKYIVLISAKSTQANNQCRTSLSKLPELNLLLFSKQPFLKKCVVHQGREKGRKGWTPNRSSFLASTSISNHCPSYSTQNTLLDFHVFNFLKFKLNTEQLYENICLQQSYTIQALNCFPCFPWPLNTYHLLLSSTTFKPSAPSQLSRHF